MSLFEDTQIVAAEEIACGKLLTAFETSHNRDLVNPRGRNQKTNLVSLAATLETRHRKYHRFRRGLAKLLARYKAAKKKQNLLDYDDLLFHFARLLRQAWSIDVANGELERAGGLSCRCCMLLGKPSGFWLAALVESEDNDCRRGGVLLRRFSPIYSREHGRS
ncbi:hypothetical protein [Bradyrhizobium diazoefficiens]|uniref:hypothetical protein n=1 Tax=Bradyrhizobium diazoefficiens TaxID=1355477 RepID=UPI00272995E5|nr:hypothetical protein [Bradyrhizobium diazoefficiens]WLA63490.1 hypothetical protein QNN01_34660 [Bradyrhizobium diazoefficiens]